MAVGAQCSDAWQVYKQLRARSFEGQNSPPRCGQSAPCAFFSPRANLERVSSGEKLLQDAPILVSSPRKHASSYLAGVCVAPNHQPMRGATLQHRLPNLLSTSRPRPTHQKSPGSVQSPIPRRCLSPSQLPPSLKKCAAQAHLGVAMTSCQMEARTVKCTPGAALSSFGISPNDAAKLVQVVSLGNSCGTKLSIRRVGFDEATLPFDWVRSSIDGLMHWLEHDFEGFLEAGKQYDLVMNECTMTVFRSRTHSFWHDDLRDAATLEKLRRRVDRFLGLSSNVAHVKPRTLLFVRSIACSDELSRMEALFELLKLRFESPDRKVFLLVIVDGQPFSAPVLHAQQERLLFWLQPTFHGPLKSDCSMPAPHEDAIAFAVNRIVSGPSDPEHELVRVQLAKEIVQKNGPLSHLGARTTETGLWVGNVLLPGAETETMFAAFEGVAGEV